MTDDEIIAVVQAHKEGKKIQLSYDGKSWNDVSFPNSGWHFNEVRYRVAPEQLKGYCFPHDLNDRPILGMIKVEQVPLDEGENPIRSKPREWAVHVLKEGFTEQGAITSFPAHEDNVKETIRVREIIE